VEKRYRIPPHEREGKRAKKYEETMIPNNNNVNIYWEEEEETDQQRGELGEKATG